MEPGGSLLQLQQPATCPLSEPDQTSQTLPLPEVSFQYYPLIYVWVF